MPDPISTLANAPLDSRVVRIALAVALGLFLGLEREWSHKPAGIRTFALISVLGAIFTFVDETVCTTGQSPCLPLFALLGGAFVTVLAGVLMVSGIRGVVRSDDSEDAGLHLTTSVGLLVAYGVGVLVGIGQLLPATVVTVASALLLVFKRELHGFAWGLSRQELRSVSEFAILAFVIYPLLPADPLTVTRAGVRVSVELQVVWLMVVFVAGMGIVNYAIVRTYGGLGVAVTGFFGGLASSTAVVGSMLDYVRENERAAGYGVAAVLLADAAMALRNAVIAVLFTLSGTTLVAAAVPLLAVVVVSVAVAYVSADWTEPLEVDLDSPFSMRNALGFGALFLVVVVVSGAGGALFGDLGFYATVALSGLVSSAGGVTSTVVLYRTGTIDTGTAVVAVVVATVSSVAVKAGLAATSSNRPFVRRVALWSAVVGAVAVAVGAAVVIR